VPDPADAQVANLNYVLGVAYRGARVTGNTRSAQLAPAYAAPRARSQASVDLTPSVANTP